MGLFAVRRHLRKRTARKGSEISVCCEVQAFIQEGHSELYKDRTLLHRTITLTDLTRSGERRRGDVGRSAEPHACSVDETSPVSSSELQSASTFFSTPVKAAGFRPPPYGKLCVSSSSHQNRRTVNYYELNVNCELDM